MIHFQSNRQLFQLLHQFFRHNSYRNPDYCYTHVTIHHLLEENKIINFKHYN